MPAIDSSIKIRKNESNTFITLSGALDHHLAVNLRAIILKTTPPVVLDVGLTPYITADGLQVLLEFYKAHNVPVTLTGVNNTTFMLIKLTGLVRYVTIGQTTTDNVVK